MKDLHSLFINPFDDQKISFDELKYFTTDHLQRLTANPVSALVTRITPTSTALTSYSATITADDTKLGQRKGSKHNKNAFRATLPAAIGKIAVAVEAQFSEGSAEFLECFPHGRTEFSNCADDKLENALQTLINGVTAHQPPLAATVGTQATALLAGWNAVYAPSETASGGKTSTRDAKKAARAALSLELYKTLATLMLQFPNQPQKLDLYMQLSLLEPHGPTPPPPEPPAPVLARSAAGLWTLTYAGTLPICWKLWARSSDNPAWSDFGEMTMSDFPAPDADVVPDNVTWWQIKICGVDGDDVQNTPFSNVISSGPVPV